MKLLAVRLARSIWLTPQYFLNPNGLFLRPVLLQMKDKYKFLKGPFDNNTIGTPDMKYELGAFDSKNGEIQVFSLTLHADGIVVDVRSSTDDGDAFLEDLSAWMNKDFGLPLYTDLPVRRAYASELNIILKKPPAFLNPKLDDFFKDVSTAIAPDETATGLLSMQFTTDPTASPTQRTFRIDREANTSFTDNRYYSFATLQTSVHLALLEKMETVLQS